jgi:hypothetical protein
MRFLSSSGRLASFIELGRELQAGISVVLYSYEARAQKPRFGRTLPQPFMSSMRRSASTSSA